MTGQRSPGELAEWIRANRTSYTREALERAMAEQGWSPEEIAAAWRLVEGPQPTTPWVQAAAGGTMTSNVRTQQILLIVLLAPVTALALLFEASLGPQGPAGNRLSPIHIVGMAVTAAIPILALVAVSRSSLPLGCAGLFGFVVLVGVGVFGACLATLSMGSMP